MSMSMNSQALEAKDIPGIAPRISSLVKGEAARWREAASANHWAVLDLPPARMADQHPPLAGIHIRLGAKAR